MEQVIRVKWSLHAREEILYELLTHLRGKASQKILETVRQNTREMIEEQDAVRDRLFTVQDVMQSNVRAWLQVPNSQPAFSNMVISSDILQKQHVQSFV